MLLCSSSAVVGGNNSTSRNVIKASKEGDVSWLTEFFAATEQKEEIVLVASRSLMEAAKNGHTEVCKVLLDAGADVNFQNKNRESALHIAAGKGDLETVTVLLEHKADLLLENKRGQTALAKAVKNERYPTIQAILYYICVTYRQISDVRDYLGLYDDSRFHSEMRQLLDSLVWNGSKSAISQCNWAKVISSWGSHISDGLEERMVKSYFSSCWRGADRSLRSLIFFIEHDLSSSLKKSLLDSLKLYAPRMSIDSLKTLLAPNLAPLSWANLTYFNEGNDVGEGDLVKYLNPEPAISTMATWYSSLDSVGAFGQLLFHVTGKPRGFSLAIFADSTKLISVSELDFHPMMLQSTPIERRVGQTKLLLHKSTPLSSRNPFGYRIIDVVADSTTFYILGGSAYVIANDPSNASAIASLLSKQESLLKALSK